MSELEVPEAWKLIRRLIKKSVAVESGMAELVRHCAQQVPGAIWTRVSALDFAADVHRLKRWLIDVLTREPPPPTVKAFWLGLFLPADTQGNVRLGLYVSGSNTFDRSDETFDWASSPAYFPADRYANSQVLKELYDFSQQEPMLFSALHEIVGVGFVALSLAQICREEPAKFVGSARSRYLAVGFDSGDGFLLGSVTAAGFKPSARGIEDHLKPLMPTRSKAEFYVFQRPSPWEWVAKEITNQGMSPLHSFTSGKREPIIDGWVTRPASNEGRPPVDVLFPITGPPIIHHRIAKKFEEMASHAVQLTPVEVLEVPPNSGPYVILNVLKRIACLDLDASKTYLFEGKLSWIIKGVIHRSRAQGEDIFVLDEYPSWIVVSRKIKEMLEAEHVRGIQLIPIETSD